MEEKAFHEVEDGVVLSCRVSPGASRNEVVGLDGEFLRLKVTAPPVEGKANKAVISLLSKTLRIPKGRVVILKGESGKQKKVLLKDVDAEEVIRKLTEVK